MAILHELRPDAPRLKTHPCQCDDALPRIQFGIHFLPSTKSNDASSLAGEHPHYEARWVHLIVKLPAVHLVFLAHPPVE